MLEASSGSLHLVFKALKGWLIAPNKMNTLFLSLDQSFGKKQKAIYENTADITDNEQDLFDYQLNYTWLKL